MGCRGSREEAHSRATAAAATSAARDEVRVAAGGDGGRAGISRGERRMLLSGGPLMSASSSEGLREVVSGGIARARCGRVATTIFGRGVGPDVLARKSSGAIRSPLAAANFARR